MKFTFAMSCGHAEDIEVADPKKYLQIDREYYRKQGLCNACWAKLHEQRRNEWHQKKGGKTQCTQNAQTA